MMLSKMIATEVSVAQVIIRNIDDAVVEALKERAALHKRSLEQELRIVLAAAVRPTPAERVSLARHIQELTLDTPQSDSTELVREDRDR